MLKVLILALAVVAVLSEQTTADCLPNQYFDQGSKTCINEQGWCKPIGTQLYASCDSCVPCPANGTCPGNQPCYQNAYCNNLGSFCGGPYTNCTATQEYNVAENKCVEIQYGYCQPTNGTWILGGCSQCQKCSGEGKECPGWEKGLSLCAKSLNCGDWSTTCDGTTPTPTPTPTPVTNSTCLPNQYYDQATKACTNEQGWCKPSANSWLYDSCDVCVKCPATGACPNNMQCVQQAYCSNLGSYCGGPYTICKPHQSYSVTKKACVDLPTGFCKPSGTWLVDSCSNCQQCWGNGEECPGYQNDGTSYCVTSINCGNWSTSCSVATQTYI